MDGEIWSRRANHHRQLCSRVSQYRLAAHYSAAVALYLGMLSTAIGIQRDMKLAKNHAIVSALNIPAVKKFRGLIHLSGMMVALTAVTGAFVAGLDAGLVYNEFPMMGDGLVPPKDELLTRDMPGQGLTRFGEICSRTLLLLSLTIVFWYVYIFEMSHNSLLTIDCRQLQPLRSSVFFHSQLEDYPSLLPVALLPSQLLPPSLRSLSVSALFCILCPSRSLPCTKLVALFFDLYYGVGRSFEEAQ